MPWLRTKDIFQIAHFLIAPDVVALIWVAAFDAINPAT